MYYTNIGSRGGLSTQSDNCYPIVCVQRRINLGELHRTQLYYFRVGELCNNCNTYKSIYFTRSKCAHATLWNRKPCGIAFRYRPSYTYMYMTNVANRFVIISLSFQIYIYIRVRASEYSPSTCKRRSRRELLESLPPLK